MAEQRDASGPAPLPGLVPRVAVFVPMTFAVVGVCGLLRSGIGAERHAGGGHPVDTMRTATIGPR